MFGLVEQSSVWTDEGPLGVGAVGGERETDVVHLAVQGGVGVVPARLPALAAELLPLVQTVQREVHPGLARHVAPAHKHPLTLAQAPLYLRS